MPPKRKTKAQAISGDDDDDSVDRPAQSTKGKAAGSNSTRGRGRGRGRGGGQPQPEPRPQRVTRQKAAAATATNTPSGTASTEMLVDSASDEDQELITPGADAAHRGNSGSDAAANPPTPLATATDGAVTPNSTTSTPGFTVTSDGDVVFGVKRKRTKDQTGDARDPRLERLKAMSEARRLSSPSPSGEAAAGTPSRALATPLSFSQGSHNMPLNLPSTPTPGRITHGFMLSNLPSPTMPMQDPMSLFSAAIPSLSMGNPSFMFPDLAAPSPIAPGLAMPHFKPGAPTNLQKSLTDSSSGFFDMMKSRFYIDIVFKLAFPKEQSDITPLVGTAYNWALFRPNSPESSRRQLIPEFTVMLYNSLSSFRGGFKPVVLKSVRVRLGFEDLGDADARARAVDLKQGAKFARANCKVVDDQGNEQNIELALAHPVVIGTIIDMLKTASLTERGSVFKTVPDELRDGIPLGMYAFACTMIKHTLDVLAGPAKPPTFSSNVYNDQYDTFGEYATRAFGSSNPVKRPLMDALRAAHLAELREAFSSAVDETPNFDDL